MAAKKESVSAGEPTVLVLRTSDKDGRSYGGFQWPSAGSVVAAPDWRDNTECGNGLHGIQWPEGDWSTLKNYDGNESWQVVEVEA